MASDLSGGDRLLPHAADAHPPDISDSEPHPRGRASPGAPSAPQHAPSVRPASKDAPAPAAAAAESSSASGGLSADHIAITVTDEARLLPPDAGAAPAGSTSSHPSSTLPGAAGPAAAGLREAYAADHAEDGAAGAAGAAGDLALPRATASALRAPSPRHSRLRLRTLTSSSEDDDDAAGAGASLAAYGASSSSSSAATASSQLAGRHGDARQPQRRRRRRRSLPEPLSSPSRRRPASSSASLASISLASVAGETSSSSSSSSSSGSTRSTLLSETSSSSSDSSSFSRSDNEEDSTVRMMRREHEAVWESSSLGLDEMGVYTWGANFWGQLARRYRGRGVDEATIVDSLRGRSVVQVAAGRSHSMALTERGEVLVWGFSRYGQVGKRMGSTYRPRDVSTFLDDPENDPAVRVFCGAHQSACLTRSGKLYTMGRNESGQLGVGHRRDLRRLTRVAHVCDGPGMEPRDCPRIVRVAFGWSHAAMICDDGHVYTWGYGAFGRLGHGSEQPQSIPTRVDLDSASPAVKVACGGGHTCVILASGALMSWGWNQHAQLTFTSPTRRWSAGQPRPPHRLRPAMCSLNQHGGNADVVCGDYFTLVLGNNGSVWTAGRVHISARRYLVHNPPREVTIAGHRAKSIHGGGRVLAVTTERGYVYAWGFDPHNSFAGTPADGSDFLNEPTHVTELRDIVSLAFGYRHAIAVTKLPLVGDEPNLFADRMLDLLREPFLSDMLVHIGSLTVRVHSCIVAAGSDVLHAMVARDRREASVQGPLPPATQADDDASSSLSSETYSSATLGSLLGSTVSEDDLGAVDEARRAVLAAYAQTAAGDERDVAFTWTLERVSPAVGLVVLAHLYTDAGLHQLPVDDLVELLLLAETLGMDRLVAQAGLAIVTALESADDALAVMAAAKRLGAVPRIETLYRDAPPQVDAAPGLADRLGLLLAKADGTDVVFTLDDGSRVAAHRAILAARCIRFRLMFRHFRESVEESICLQDIPGPVFRLLVGWLYSNTADVPPEHVVDLLIHADAFQLPALMVHCERIIAPEIDSDNAAAVFHLASAHRAVSLRRVALFFIIGNYAEVSASAGWAELPDSLREEVNEHLPGRTSGNGFAARCVLM